MPPLQAACRTVSGHFVRSSDCARCAIGTLLCPYKEKAVAKAATEVEDWFFVYRAYDRGGHLNARIGEAYKAIDLFNTAATLIRTAYSADLSHPLTLRALTHLHINLVGQYWNQGKIALAWSAHLESGRSIRSVLRPYALTENPDLYEVGDYKIIPVDQRIQDRFYASIILNEIRFRVEMGRPREALALSRALVLRLQRWSEKNRIDENKLVKAHVTVAWVLRYLGYEKEAIDKQREALTVYGTRRDSPYYFEFAQYNHDLARFHGYSDSYLQNMESALEAIREDASFSGYHCVRRKYAGLLFDAGREAEALEIFDDVVKRTESRDLTGCHIEALFHRTEYEERSNSRNVAEESYFRVLKYVRESGLKADELRIYRAYARWLRKRSRYEEALVILEKALLLVAPQET